MSAAAALSILLVDDESELLAEIARYLRRRGHNVETAASYSTGVELIDRASAPDVLISDVRMPGGTGLDLARRARQRHPRCRVIIMTGHLDQDEPGTGDELDAATILYKPFSFSRLLGLVSGTPASGSTAPLPSLASTVLTDAA